MCRTAPASSLRPPLSRLRPRLQRLAVPALAAALYGAPVPADEVVSRRVVAMGTVLDVTVSAPSREAALAASELAIRAVARVEARLSTWRDDSELSALNSAPVDVPVRLSPALAAELRAARGFWLSTGGAFDPGIGSLVAAWGLRTGGRRPGPGEIRAGLSGGGFARLELAGETAVRRHPGVVIEEGGFAKGMAIDAALAEAGPGCRMLLDFGGQLAVGAGSEIAVGIGHPERREEPAVGCMLRSGSIATTGASERGVRVGGVRLGHVLDPRTGELAADFGSLSVWAATATAADCLSTGLYVLGPEGAMKWAAEHPEFGVLVLERAGSTVRARVSVGWPGEVTAAAAGVELEHVTMR